MTAQTLLVTAEVDYRLARATARFAGGRAPRVRRPRTHRVPRRPALHLPQPRLRPLGLA